MNWSSYKFLYIRPLYSNHQRRGVSLHIILLYKNKTLNNYWVYDTQEEIDELEKQQEKYKNLK